VTAARSCQGADRAARALLLQQPGRSHDLWWMWGVIVLRALLEAAVAACAPDGGRRRRGSAALLEDWAAAILDGDLAGPRAALQQATNTGAESIEALVADANLGLDRFEPSVIIRLGDRCVQSVGVTVVTAIGMWRRPPPAITCGEWFAARWRAVDLAEPHEANLYQLVADERAAAGRTPGGRPGHRRCGDGCVGPTLS
jgi:hypothetical protein